MLAKWPIMQTGLYAAAKDAVNARRLRVVPAPAVGTTAAAPLYAIRAFVTDLFATANPAAPLADRLRPTAIDEVIGQRHLLAPGKPLAVAFASGKPHSMLLWGPPGASR